MFSCTPLFGVEEALERVRASLEFDRELESEYLDVNKC